MCVDPLPLLTATCNHSGGSYHGYQMDEVCSWTWDIISVEDEAPYGYQEVIYNFVDEGIMLPEEREEFRKQ